MKASYISFLISLILVGLGSVSVWTGHTDGNWLIAPGILIWIILGLVGGLGRKDGR